VDNAVALVVDNVVTSTADDVGEGAIDDLAKGAIDDVAEGTADDVAEGTVDDVAEETADNVAEGTVDDVDDVADSTNDVVGSTTNNLSDIGDISSLDDGSYLIQGLGRQFITKDEFVPEIVSKIEKMLPGTVKQVGTQIVDSPDSVRPILTELDIVTDTVIFEVKTGNAKGLTAQLQNTSRYIQNREIIAIVDATKGKGKFGAITTARNAGFRIIEIDRRNPDFSEIIKILRR
jgi:hypothetical protein